MDDITRDETPGATQDFPSMDERRSRHWAVAAQVAPLAALLVLPVGPLVMLAIPAVILYLRRYDDPFAADHARSNINLQLTALIALFVPVLLLIVGAATVSILPVAVSLTMLVAFLPWWLYAQIAGAVKASNGDTYQNRLTIRFLKAG